MDKEESGSCSLHIIKKLVKLTENPITAGDTERHNSLLSKYFTYTPCGFVSFIIFINCTLLYLNV